MITTFLVRGMLIGILAGFLAFGFAKIFGEPQVEKALAFEEQMEHVAHAESAAHEHEEVAGHDAGGHDEHEEELVSRNMQSTFGLLTAVVVYGAAIGGLFALAFAVAYGRVRMDPRSVALLLAAGGFLVLTLVPGLKYPPNPPSVGRAETIGFRTETYFMMILLAAVTLSFAVWLRSNLLPRIGAWNATLAGAGAFIAIIATAILLLPDINEVPEAFSAVVLWHFRLASIGTQAVLWATLGLLFGALTERSLRTQQA
jgi:predicted cobalt transporter CbtA